MVKNPPANAGDIETWVRSLDQDDTVEEEMTTHSSILAWRIPWTDEPGGLQPMGSYKSRTRLKQLSPHAPDTNMQEKLLSVFLTQACKIQILNFFSNRAVPGNGTCL